MRTHSISLSILFVTLELVSANAKQCLFKELSDRIEKLPPFIVVPDNSTPDDVLARSLDCTRPPPPTFAGGKHVDLDQVIGHQVFTPDGKHIGEVAGVAVDPNTTQTKSLVKMSYGTEIANAAVPFQTLTFDDKTKNFFMEDFKGDLDKKWPVGSDTEWLGKDIVVAVKDCLMCAYSDTVWIDITSEPSGGNIFIANQQQGNTELKGLIKLTAEPSIRIEYPKRRSCTFSDGTYKSPEATGLGYATFFCKLVR